MDEYVNKWHGCYDDSWQGIIVPEAFAHPAKMSYGLTQKIFKHALSEGWLAKGDVVVDPFGGIGSTGIIGAYQGLRVVCVELEQKFVDLAKQNFELHRKKLDAFNHFGHSYQPQIIQGDSRRLSEVIAGADCVISSPPYAETMSSEGHGIDLTKCERDGDCSHWGSKKILGKQNYGTTKGNLGNLKPGEVDAVVSSPPYEGCQVDSDTQRKAPNPSTHLPDAAKTKGYGKSDGQLGNLKPGEVDAVVSSPPFEDSLQSQDIDFENKRQAARGRNIQGAGHLGSLSTYGSTDGNIGNDKDETFWQAARQIVTECHKILKPGGHAIWVVKAFVRKGAIVDFPGDWRRLCLAQGFTTVHEHHAMLVKETKHNGLFEEITETKERKSFFRRLAEKKGSPKIDYEVVLCTQKQ